MKQKIFLVLILSVVTANAQLKETFKKGLIVKNDSSKIEGYIKTDDLSKLSSRICFKQKLEDKKCQAYTTTDINYFETVDGVKFYLFDLKINTNKMEIDVFASLIFKSAELSLFKSMYEGELLYVLVKDNKKYVLQNDKLVAGETEVTTYHFKATLNILTKGYALLEHPKIEFEEDEIVEIITKYSNSINVKNEDLRIKVAPENFILINAGIGFKKNANEYFGQGMYRKYYPEISRSTSLNFGLSYFSYQSKNLDNDFNLSLLSVPLMVQQNIFNKKIRPYFFAGLSFNYLQLEDENGISLTDEILQPTQGINFLYGGGIEIDIKKGFYFKSEYRKDSYSHLINFGMGYIFKIKPRL